VLVTFEKIGKVFGYSTLGRYFSSMYLDFLALYSLKKYSYDVIFTQPYFLRSIRYASKKNIKIIIEMDSAYPIHQWFVMKKIYNKNKIRRVKWDSWNFYPYVKNASKSIFFADKIIVFGNYPATTLLMKGIDSRRIIKSIPPARDLGRSVNFLNSEQPLFVWIGNDGMRKALDVLCGAWQLYKLEGGMGKLHIYGKNSKSQSSLRKIIGSLPDVEDYGYVDSKIINDQGIFTLISISYSEGFPRTVVEFMSAGHPVIANFPGGSEVLEHGVNGWVCTASVVELKNVLFEVDQKWKNILEMGEFAKKSIRVKTSNHYKDTLREILNLLAN
jgi:glycosyltransferase involved in cell wall biosynthesis